MVRAVIYSSVPTNDARQLLPRTLGSGAEKTGASRTKSANRSLGNRRISHSPSLTLRSLLFARLPQGHVLLEKHRRGRLRFITAVLQAEMISAAVAHRMQSQSAPIRQPVSTAAPQVRRSRPTNMRPPFLSPSQRNHQGRLRLWLPQSRCEVTTHNHPRDRAQRPRSRHPRKPHLPLQGAGPKQNATSDCLIEDQAASGRPEPDAENHLWHH